MTGELETSVEDETGVISEYSLSSYPNPFNASTTIRFSLPHQAQVSLEVYDLRGNRIATLAKEHRFKSGVNHIRWHATEVPSGLYFAKIQSGIYSQTQKLILLK